MILVMVVNTSEVLLGRLLKSQPIGCSMQPKFIRIRDLDVIGRTSTRQRQPTSATQQPPLTVHLHRYHTISTLPCSPEMYRLPPALSRLPSSASPPPPRLLRLQRSATAFPAPISLPTAHPPVRSSRCLLQLNPLYFPRQLRPPHPRDRPSPTSPPYDPQPWRTHLLSPARSLESSRSALRVWLVERI